jgi:two-component system chemotaxis response regulator CheY
MSKPSTQPTVLIVDDEPLVRSWIRTALANLGCQVRGDVADGTQAILRHAKLRPDITFLDINMPGKNGIDTLREILRASPDAFVVMVSADSTLDNVQRAIKHGASGFIVKPFTINKFRMVLDKYLNEAVME